MKQIGKIAAALLALTITAGASAAVYADSVVTRGETTYRVDDRGVMIGIEEGWERTDEGDYYYKNGKMLRNSWLEIDGEKTYYFLSDGKMATGKKIVDNGNYYFGKDGKRVIRKAVIKDKYGEYSASTMIVYLKTDADDERINTTLKKYGLTVKKRYRTFNGVMLTTGDPVTSAELNQLIKRVAAYGFVKSVERDLMIPLEPDEPDAPKTPENGWYKTSSASYYYRNGKAVKSSWVEDNGSRYYFGKNGEMTTGTVTIDGRTYNFGSDGRYVKNPDTFVYKGTMYSASTVVVYLVKKAPESNIDTICQKHGLSIVEKDSARRAFLLSTGDPITSQDMSRLIQKLGTYSFVKKAERDDMKSFGTTETLSKVSDGWYRTGTASYYYRNGEPVKNEWIEDNGKRFYFGSDGKMTEGSARIDGRTYTFAADGSVVSNPGVITYKGRTFSASTLIVYVKPKTTEKKVRQMCKDLGLDLVYNYSSINAVAVSTGEPLSFDDLKILIRTIKKYTFVSDVEFDYVTETDTSSQRAE